jgi:hypothetical protein
LLETHSAAEHHAHETGQWPQFLQSRVLGAAATRCMAGEEVMGDCCPDFVAVRSSAHNILSLYQRLQ